MCTWLLNEIFKELFYPDIIEFRFCNPRIWFGKGSLLNITLLMTILPNFRYEHYLLNFFFLSLFHLKLIYVFFNASLQKTSVKFNEEFSVDFVQLYYREETQIKRKHKIWTLSAVVERDEELTKSFCAFGFNLNNLNITCFFGTKYKLLCLRYRHNNTHTQFLLYETHTKKCKNNNERET